LRSWGLDIAAALHISNHTVESYYSRILIKVDLNGVHELRHHAIAYLQKHTHITFFVFSS
jgi:DNA-binding NarL/FixJ family response regulator